ncbi:endoplasmic reticulum membrane protein [Ceratobasidium sp. AG-Ba]|nr:endoplasmic reticulum membrane protein [Ceratobasidium sp. AG-Ba]
MKKGQADGLALTILNMRRSSAGQQTDLLCSQMEPLTFSYTRPADVACTTCTPSLPCSLGTIFSKYSSKRPTGHGGAGWRGKRLCLGCVAKNEMQALRKQRWDVSFTKTTDNAAVAPTLSVMAEVADITDVLLKSPSGQALAKVLNDPSVVKHLKYLLITDQPAERPENGPVPANQRERHLLLSLYVPEPSEATNTVPLLKEVFNLVDVVDQKAAFKIETHKKLKKTRADLDVELQKEAEKEKRDEAEEKKAAEKRKAAEERLARLSAAEQKKASKSHCFAAAYL